MFSLSNAALLIIDMQNDFVSNRLSPVFIPNASKITKNIVKTRFFFKLKKKKVIHIITSHPRDISECGYMDRKLKRYYCIDNSEGERIVPELAPADKNEIILKKKLYSGFYETGLLELLQKYQIKKLFFSGLTTGCCVSSTAREAYNYNFELFFLADCLTSSSKTAHLAELRFFGKSLGQVIDSRQISGF